MRTRESSRRTLTHFLGSFHQLIEHPLCKIRTRQQNIVVIKIVTDGKKILRNDIVHTDGREIELRTCYGYENIDQIINEKRSDHHERYLLKPFETEDEIVDYHHRNHRIISEITHIERFTEPNGMAIPHELHRRLTTKKPLLR